MSIKNKRPDVFRSVCFLKGYAPLYSLYVHRIQSLRRLFRVERHRIAFMEFVEVDTDKSIHVEEEIFLKTFSGNEAKSFLGELFDYTSH